MEANQIAQEWKQHLIGQDHAIKAVMPFVTKYLVALNRPNRPVGNFLFLGPTGSGKTRAIEALAQVLHGSPTNMLKVDCGEFQMEHEVAKLIGSPPGYLGHRETHPVFSQQRINSVTSEDCDLSIVLFDEIEKAAPSMWRLLLGILDKATLRLGDNTVVNFERCLIAMTSNVGATEMANLLSNSWGFGNGNAGADPHLYSSDSGLQKLQKMGQGALSRKFPPEFENRLDSVITFRPHTHETLESITHVELEELQQHITNRLGEKAFQIIAEPEVVQFLVANGTSGKFGARELKRTIDRHLYDPIVVDFADHKIGQGDTVRIFANGNGLGWEVIHQDAPSPIAVVASCDTCAKQEICVDANIDKAADVAVCANFEQK